MPVAERENLYHSLIGECRAEVSIIKENLSFLFDRAIEKPEKEIMPSYRSELEENLQILLAELKKVKKSIVI